MSEKEKKKKEKESVAPSNTEEPATVVKEIPTETEKEKTAEELRGRILREDVKLGGSPEGKPPTKLFVLLRTSRSFLIYDTRMKQYVTFYVAIEKLCIQHWSNMRK